MKSSKKRETICAGELIDLLSNFDENLPVYVYSGFNRFSIRQLEDRGEFLLMKLGDVSNITNSQNFEDDDEDEPLIA